MANLIYRYTDAELRAEIDRVRAKDAARIAELERALTAARELIDGRVQRARAEERNLWRKWHEVQATKALADCRNDIWQVHQEAIRALGDD